MTHVRERRIFGSPIVEHSRFNIDASVAFSLRQCSQNLDLLSPLNLAQGFLGTQPVDAVVLGHNQDALTIPPPRVFMCSFFLRLFLPLVFLGRTKEKRRKGGKGREENNGGKAGGGYRYMAFWD